MTASISPAALSVVLREFKEHLDIEPEKGRLLSRCRSDAWDSGNHLTQFHEEVYECGLCYGEGVVTVERIIERYGCPIYGSCPFQNCCPLVDYEIYCPSCNGEGKIVVW